MSTFDKLRMFAESREPDVIVVRDGFTYGDVRVTLRLLRVLRTAMETIHALSVDRERFVMMGPRGFVQAAQIAKAALDATAPLAHDRDADDALLLEVADAFEARADLRRRQSELEARPDYDGDLLVAPLPAFTDTEDRLFAACAAVAASRKAP